MTDIAASMPDFEHVLFDYNEFDEANNTMTVAPLQVQVRKLKEKLESLGNDHDVTIDLVAHSQGCLVAAIAKPVNVRKMVFIAPPDNTDTDRLIKFFGDRPGSVINLEGESRVPRRDGTTTVIHSTYWKSLHGLNAISLYNRLPDLADVTFIIANDDEVLGISNFDKTDERIKLEQLDGSHDFAQSDRHSLVNRIQELLKSDK